MEPIEQSLSHYYKLKCELLVLAQQLNSCDAIEREFYQDAVLCYSKHLKEMNKLLEEEFGLNMCSY
ncbi:hypothetical protein ACFVL4_22570 [Bacillus subtilis]|uniref:hypothetical protein n=1 Tax=Bacillus subtilis group TaxID=653685 RepID=UPI00059D6701|nr:hypothetical protein [Bacillus subtilis]ODV48118.1 hypothetical protein BCM26_04000 [Bacillus subtilis]OJH64065.1 hypothetical protein BOH71_06945 [Bacillus subtilis]RPJ98123.1 hypothetical protein EH11_04203 [Bacillus subtilis]